MADSRSCQFISSTHQKARMNSSQKGRDFFKGFKLFSLWTDRNKTNHVFKGKSLGPENALPNLSNIADIFAVEKNLNTKTSHDVGNTQAKKISHCTINGHLHLQASDINNILSLGNFLHRLVKTDVPSNKRVAWHIEFPCCLLYLVVEKMRMHSPVSSFRSWKNFWLKMKATPLISSTLASAVVFLFIKLAVIAIASFPRNSFLLKPAEQRQELKPLLTSDWTFREGQLKAAQCLSCSSSNNMPSVDSTMPPKFPWMESLFSPFSAAKLELHCIQGQVSLKNGWVGN